MSLEDIVVDGCFSPHPLLWLWLLLCLFRHYFLQWISHAHLFGKFTLLFFLTVVLGSNATDLTFEEMHNIFDRGNLPLKIEIEHEEGKEVAHIDDDDTDGHDIDEILGWRNSSWNLDSHLPHDIDVHPHEDVRIDAGVGKCLRKVVMDKIILTVEVVQQTQFERIVYREIRCRWGTLTLTEVVSLLHYRARVLHKDGFYDRVQLGRIVEFVDRVGQLFYCCFHVFQRNCWDCACVAGFNCYAHRLSVHIEHYLPIVQHFIEGRVLPLEFLWKKYGVGEVQPHAQ